MFLHNSNDEATGPVCLSVPFQQSMDAVALDHSAESASSSLGKMANVPSISNHAGLGSKSNVLSTTTSLLVPSHPTAHSGASYQMQPQIPQIQKVTIPRNLQTVATHFTNLVIKDWIPCVFSPDEVQLCQLETCRRIQIIRNLEAEENRLIPMKSVWLEQALFRARLEYKVHFSRIFRINDLPLEVLDNIFRYVIWSAVGPDQRVRWRLWLTWVCRHWRETALSDPMLWNSIWIKDLPNFQISFASLERSVNAPLDIRIDDTQENPISLAVLDNLLQRLLEKISNIRTFIVVFQEWDPILVILDRFRVVQERNLPMILERFEIHRAGSVYIQIGDGYEPSSHVKPIPLFGGATVSSFNHLSLNGLHVDWANSILTNLTTLDMRRMPLERGPTLTQFRALLSGSPALRKLFLDGAGPGLSEAALGIRMKPVHIPSLKVLVLGDFCLRYAMYICSQLFIPNVVELTLMNLGGEDYSGLYDLLRSSMPLVKILTLSSVKFVPNPRSSISIIKWLESMPLVTYFHIVNAEPQFLELLLYNCKTLRSLAESQTFSPHIPCPKLAFLEFEVIHSDVVARWAHIRKRLGSPLQKIFLSIDAASRISNVQYQRLASTLESGGAVQVLAPGSLPAERA